MYLLLYVHFSLLVYMCDISAHPDLCVYQTELNTVYLKCDLLKLRAAFSFT